MQLNRLFTLAVLLFSAQALAVDYFPLNQVRLLESPFRHAQDKNIEYVMAMEPDRLLAPYLVEAGLEPRAENYANWEGSGLNGHIGGHYLSALSLAYAAIGRQDVLDRLQYMLDELQRAQRANGNGYLGGVPGGDELWRQIAAGDIRADLFALNDSWVPWYNVHKIFAGLRDAWLYTGSEQARVMLIAWADWAAGLVSGLSDEQIQTMLLTEHGGMNEVFADVAAITGDESYLELARRFSHQAILKPLLQGQDRLTGLHANTQIPKVIGYQRFAQESGNEQWQKAARFFWNTIVNERSVAIGGNSVREHFHDKNDFGPMIEDVEGPETCNTYNMLRLTRLLYSDSPQLEYVNYYERALYNHILSSQDPASGGLVYFTPMRPQHYRVYSQAQQAMWCCVGSGIENHMKYGEFIYARDGDELYVNLFIASTLNWPEKNVRLRQENRFPDQSSTRLVFESDTNISLKLRYPAWAVNGLTVLINGARSHIEARPGSYITLNRTWKKGDTVSLELPMATWLEQMPDGSDYYAILYGPIVLSAPASPFEDEVLDYFADDSRMGHIPRGQMCPLEASPVFVFDTPDFADRIERVGDGELRFRFQDMELIPFFRVHRTRYMLYWPFSTPDQLDERRSIQARDEEARLLLESLTIDTVAPGEQQPESDHGFFGENTEAGVNAGRHWRHATGWFGYRLNDPEGEAKDLRVDYFGADAGRTFTIELNGLVIAEVTLTGEQGPVFHSLDYPLPEEALSAIDDGKHTLRFVAGEGSVAGGIYGVRLLRALPAE
ncbi:beta-L-arabinofuranosidase domain-containing protein [Pseudomonadota bacterium]